MVFSNLADIHTLKSIAGALSPMLDFPDVIINAFLKMVII